MKTKIYDIVVLSGYCHGIVASYAPYYHNLGEVHNKIVYLLVNQEIDFKHGLKFEGRANLTYITNDVQTDVKLGQI